MAGRQQVGLVGLAVMGENLALNIASKGFSLAVFNRTGTKTDAFLQGRAAGKKIVGAHTPQELCNAVETPRRILLMVKSGAPVDEMIAQLRPHLQQGDLLIDGGNSFFQDTERRAADLAVSGLLYIGTGVSGGEEGALKGPCIMPGGSPDAYAGSKTSSRRSPPRSTARAAPTSGPAAPATTSRWSTTGSSTASCSASPRRTTSCGRSCA